MPRPVPRSSPAFAWHGWRVDDCRGARVGTLAGVYADECSGAPAWFLVRLGRYSTRYVLTPATDVLGWPGRISLPWERARIERAPLLYTAPAVVGPDRCEELRLHFGLAAASDVRLRARRSVA